MCECVQLQATISFSLFFELLPKIPIMPMHGNRIPSSTHRQFRTISCWSISPSLSLDPFLLIICWLSIIDKFPTNCVMPPLERITTVALISPEKCLRLDKHSLYSFVLYSCLRVLLTMHILLFLIVSKIIFADMAIYSKKNNFTISLKLSFLVQGARCSVT